MNKRLMKIDKVNLKNLNKLKDKNGAIDLKDFNSIVSNARVKSNDEFSFQCNIEEIETNKYLISFMGKHFAKNVIQNWHRGILLRYKKAIKQSARDGFLRFNSVNNEFKTLNQVKVLITIYNPRSRDDDANYDTLKWMRDTFTFNNFIIDDNREVILETKEMEVISKEWKIEFEITKV